MIIDTHTHFYDPTRPQGIPWPPKDNLLLYRTVLPEHHRCRRALDDQPLHTLRRQRLRHSGCSGGTGHA